MTSDPIVELLEEAIRGFQLTKRRYPLLVAIYREGERLERLEVRRKGRSLAFDHPVLQLVRDSFDMLVIDLYSLRQSMVGDGGILNLLRENPGRLRRAQAVELPTHNVLVSGITDEATRERLRAEGDMRFREMVAQSVNKSLDWLVPGENPVTTVGLNALIKRFREDTEATDADRNRVRAHRFEQADRRFFQSLPQIKEQLEVFEEYLGKLFHVLTHNSMGFDLNWVYSSADSAANDLADIMVHGSINRACLAYDVIPERSEGNPRPWYWSKRNQYFAVGSALGAIRGLFDRVLACLRRRAV